MMIIHLFPKSQFTEAFVHFINNHFDEKEHLFVLYTNVVYNLDECLFRVKNVVDYDKKSIWWLYRELKNADRIIFHNLSVNIYELFMFLLCPQLVRKSVWLIWGGDLYCYRNERKKIMDKVVECMRRQVIHKFPIIATLTAGDFELAKKWYKIKARNIRVQYIDEKNVDLLSECISNQSVGNDVFKILVGNSATKTNQHKEVLDILRKYKKENFKIYAPLSYGNKEYGDEIEKLGKEYFGNKFVAIREYMSLKEYYQLLTCMNVVIFNNDRQQALGNIIALAFLGKKIYLREGTSMWDEWVVEQDYPFHAFSDIQRESFGEFKEQNHFEIEREREFAMSYYDVEKRIEEWKTLFSIDLSAL